MATLPVWLEIPPLPGDTSIDKVNDAESICNSIRNVKIKRIIPERRKIYSSLLKIVRREKAND